MKNFFKIIFLSVVLQIHAAGEQETVKYKVFPEALTCRYYEN